MERWRHGGEAGPASAPEWMLEAHATLFADASVEVSEGKVAKLRYVGDCGWFLMGKGKLEH